MGNSFDLLGFPRKRSPESTIQQIVVTNGTTYGSTGTKVRLFTNIIEKSGEAVVYVKDTVFGDYFKINQPGQYAITYQTGVSAGSVIVVSLNATSLTANPAGLALAQLLVTHRQSGSSGDINTVACTAYLKAGDIIRAQDNGDQQSDNTSFRITMVSIGQ